MARCNVILLQAFFYFQTTVNKIPISQVNLQYL